MSVLTAGFENGINGNGISTAGGEANASAWNQINNFGAVYSNAQVAHGALAMKMPTTTRPNLQWTTASVEKWGRFYVYLPSTLSGYASASFVGVSGGGSCTVSIADTGCVAVGFNSSPFSVKGVVSIARDQWVRIEWHALPGNSGTGQIDARLYNSADSTSISETITGAARDVGNAWTAITMGFQNVNIAGGDCYMDQIVGDATAFPGPFPVSTVAPVVTGSPSVGSTLTSDTGTWNGGATFTITYQWFRDATPIGGATSNAYTIAPADGGHVIACAVTATGVQATNESATATSNGTSVAGAPSVLGPAPLMGRFP